MSESGSLAAKELERLRGTLESFRRTEVAGFDTYWIAADALDEHLRELAEAIADERELMYDAGFSNGIRATLNQIEGMIFEGATLDGVKEWADAQWEEQLTWI